MSESTIQLRQDGEPSDERTSYESPDVGTQAVCASWLANAVAESLDSEYIEADVSEDAQVMAQLDRTTSNYGVYETPGSAVDGIYLSHKVLAEVFGESDEDDAPEAVGLTFRASEEDAFEEAADDAVDEDEIEGLVAGGDDEAEADESEDEGDEVGIDDEEIGLVEGE